jgi:transitional endoplasmic reticulum ATPase
MQIRLVFYRSSSKYYDTCCLNCERFDFYVNDKSKNTVVIEDEEIRNKRTELSNVLTIIKNWSKSEFYIDNKKTNAAGIEQLLHLLNCEKAKDEEVIGDHCFAINGWGCNLLDEIGLRDNGYMYYHRNRYYWYQFGSFECGKWMINKDRIKAQLKNEVDGKKLQFCKRFDINRVYSEVDKLPEFIIVDEEDSDCEWQYIFRDAPAGIKQTEIIGVEPKKGKQSFGDGFTFDVGSVFSHSKETEHLNSDKKNVPSVTFEDIGGMDEIIQQVREVIELPMISPGIFEHYHLTPHKGVLLYGPPGCGKTMIAKAIANEINAHFISVKGPEILNKYVGQSEENLRKVFEEAKKFKPSIIYFDEFDSISTRRDADDHLSLSTIVNQLLTLMDGMEKTDVCCIASTNRIDMIDEAIKRPGRFDYVIEIEKPSLEGCMDIFRIHTEQMPVEDHFDKNEFVKQYLTGLTGAEIAFVASEAAYNSIRRTINIKDIFAGSGEIRLTDNNIITNMDFIKAVKTLKDRKTRAETAKFRYNS